MAFQVYSVFEDLHESIIKYRGVRRNLEGLQPLQRKTNYSATHFKDLQGTTLESCIGVAVVLSVREVIRVLDLGRCGFPQA